MGENHGARLPSHSSLVFDDHRRDRKLPSWLAASLFCQNRNQWRLRHRPPILGDLYMS